MSSAEGIQCIAAEGFVIFNIAKDSVEAVRPCAVAAVPGNALNCLCPVNPAEQLKNILEMIIKGLAVQAAVLHKMPDSDFVQRSVLHQLLEGIGQCFFGQKGSRHKGHLILKSFEIEACVTAGYVTF
ncbi:hypothetical protein D3C80_1458880 [compost metagenome]